TSVTVNTPITGWSVNDVITIDTEAVTITSISGGTVNFSPALTLNHLVSSTGPVVVASLSRNAVVMSSRTNTSTTTAYIQNLAKNATSFALTYGEFAYLGANAISKYGITFDGSGTAGSL